MHLITSLRYSGTGQTNRTEVTRPSFSCAGDAIHPGVDETSLNSSCVQSIVGDACLLYSLLRGLDASLIMHVAMVTGGNLGQIHYNTLLDQEL